MRFLLLLILLISFPAHAERQRMALVIGNQDYHITPLGNPLNDARDIAAVLQKTGFQVTLKLNAGQVEMESAIRDFGARLNTNTEALFYYSGHGVQHAGENYLIPIGAINTVTAAEHLRYKTVPAGYVLGTLKAAQSPLNIVVLDACRNSPFKGFSKNLQRGLARMPNAEGTLIAYATAPDKVAFDRGSSRNSPYTQHLLSFMQQPGLTLEQVLKRTRSAVKKTTGNRQTPWYESSLDGDFYFVAGRRNDIVPSAVIPQPAPRTARLTMRSNQYHDEVWIDGKAYGATPVEIDLPLGRHQVRVTKPGFEDFEQWLELRKNTKVMVRLQPEPQPRDNIAASEVIPLPSNVASHKKITVSGRTYLAYDNGTALDTETGLMWMRCRMGQEWTGITCRGKAKWYLWDHASNSRSSVIPCIINGL